MVNCCSSQCVEIVQEIGQICPCILSLEKNRPEDFGETSAGVAMNSLCILTRKRARRRTFRYCLSQGTGFSLKVSCVITTQPCLSSKPRFDVDA